MMNETDAADLLKKASERTIEVWLDGGWGVDALVGRQTRPHDDIDLFVQWKDATAIMELLLSENFREVPAEYTNEGHTAWRTDNGRTVDLHLFEFAEDGGDGNEANRYGGMLLFEGESYPASLLDGRGTIGGVAVRCLTPEAQLLYHQGYEHNENDVHDVVLLCGTFGLPVPDEYDTGSAQVCRDAARP
jgi:lincosamide nucleotidyltransferase A/C/D/E